MTLVPVAPPTGICLSASNYAAGKDAAYVASGNAFRQGSGRWVGAYNVEFIAGFPQKIAGWALATSGKTVGIPRCVRVWRDASGNAQTGIGTESHLYTMMNGNLTDITPLRTISGGTLTNPFTTTNGNTTVAVADNTQNLQNGDWIYLSAASAIGGVSVLGWYQVSGRSGTGYNITVAAPATSGAGPGGGIVSFQYPRVTLTNPFATLNGSPIVTVTHNNHGAAVNNYVTYSGAGTVAGLMLNGEYQILSVPSANTYTVMASANANATTTGGGSVSAVYPIQVQQVSYSQGVPYGGGAYGAGAYGFGVASIPTLSNGWTLDAYGSQLLGAPIGGTIYIYDPAAGGRAYPMLNAPQSMNAMFVTPERFVVALGINGNSMQMAWCDQSNYTVWTSLPSNTANSGRTIVGGSYLVGGIAIRDGVSLFFSDRCAFEMSYTGNNFIYNTPQIGDNCGLVDPTALCAEGGVAYWMSDQDFWQWNGGVQPLQSDDIRESVFQGGLNRQYLHKCTAMLNRAKRQVRFFYPSASATENDSGMIYQFDTPGFAPLAYGRTCGTDAELLGVPLSADATGAVYYDETGVDAAGAALPWYLEVSEMDLSNGDRNIDVMGFIPDFQTLAGSVTFTVLTRYYPSQTAVQRANTVTSATDRLDLREDGKLVSFSLAANAVGSNFRLGVPRWDIQPSGARS